jgi:hypothetical protein
MVAAHGQNITGPDARDLVMLENRYRALVYTEVELTCLVKEPEDFERLGAHVERNIDVHQRKKPEMVDMPVAQQDAVHLAALEGGPELLLQELHLGRWIEPCNRGKVPKPQIVPNGQVSGRFQAVAEVVCTAEEVLAEVEKQAGPIVLQVGLAPAYLVYCAVKRQFD